MLGLRRFRFAAGCAGLLVAAAAAAVPEKKWAGIHEGGYVTTIAIDPTSPSRVYVATARGFFGSADDGQTWTPISPGVDGHFVGSLAIDPGPPAVLWAGTNGGALLRSSSPGSASWTRLDSERSRFFV
ncbi:MAG TPA: hypothetical protein VIZ69_08635, partial [Thermoanaerobaculia bacterium]